MTLDDAKEHLVEPIAAAVTPLNRAVGGGARGESIRLLAAPMGLNVVEEG